MVESHERKQRALAFIKSKDFGIDTYRVIVLFKFNISIIIRTLKLYSTFIFNDKLLPLLDNPDDQTIQSIKQQMVLDTIMKLQILIESFIVLIHSLHDGYKVVPHNMTFYSQELVDEIVNKILEKPNEYNLLKIAGLCEINNIESLDINKI